MDKFELEQKLKEEIRARVLGDGFMKIVQTVRRGGKTFRISMRPVNIAGEKRFQAEMTDDGQVRVKNLSPDDAAAGLEEIIAQKGAREMHLMTATGDLHVRVTRKGHVLTSRSAEMSRVAAVQPHDRVKKLPLTSFDSASLLRAIGVTDGSGEVRASMRGKYDQVNEFLKAVKETVGDFRGERTGVAEGRREPFVIVDCGCGKAYLTLCLYFYLVESLGYPDVRVVGVDRRADVIAAARRMAEQLDVSDKVVFAESELSEFDVSDAAAGGKVDMVVSLHACDTATDEALAKGVEWKAQYILSAPCCQHELQRSIGSGSGGRTPAEDAFAGLLRQNILRERLCDILTDSFRALILRILGYRTQVVEFVSPDATARNIMLKCSYGVKCGQTGPVVEYLALRDYWKVTPWLETRLGSRLARHLDRLS